MSSKKNNKSKKHTIKRENRAVINDSQTSEIADEPLVTIIIPTFERPRLFRIALESVLNQTYKNLDIFITDNSHNDETEKLMQPYLAKDPRIKYEHHDEYDASANWKRARGYNNPDAEYVNWLMDDDVFAPTKIEKMIAAFRQCPTATLVTSYRPLIDIDGNPLPDKTFNKRLIDRDGLIRGKEIGRKVLFDFGNYIGEPSTVLIKKAALNNFDLGWSGREGKYLVSDWPTWLCCLAKGDLFYFAEPLSFFRAHMENGQKKVLSIYNSIICWFMEIDYAWETHAFFDTPEEYAVTLLNFLTRVCKWLTPTSAYIYNRAFENPVTDELTESYDEMLHLQRRAFMRATAIIKEHKLGRLEKDGETKSEE